MFSICKQKYGRKEKVNSTWWSTPLMAPGNRFAVTAKANKCQYNLWRLWDVDFERKGSVKLRTFHRYCTIAKHCLGNLWGGNYSGRRPKVYTQRSRSGLVTIFILNIIFYCKCNKVNETNCVIFVLIETLYETEWNWTISGLC